MRMNWKRPASFPVGQVWSRFQGRERDGKPACMYQIRDMDERWRKQCLDMMQKTFIDDEPLCQILEIEKDPASIQTIRSNWEDIADQGLCIACFTEELGQPKDLVGFNILLVKSREDAEENLDTIKGEQWKKLLRTLTVAEQLVDVFDLYKVDQILTSSGLTVLPGHRGQNIGARIIAVREQICKTFNIYGVATVFTAITSQVLAAKCGYRTLAELNYEDMKPYGIDLTGCTTKSAKLMGIKYTF
ncbi:uncharacterized protein LOC125055296 isoform X1 [Pieris napi]|uniref:uncharacterized protein LOC125055296 isoform X1 n=2 Tax=Pieris napi TaxID=78633 RepID=UPI001FB8CF94|nr:uncharacterized protein LOC125055296 isoform X1 [Pieris napi]